MEQSYRPDKDVRDAVVVWSGTTTLIGNPGGTTLTDSGLTQGNNYWINMAVEILGGNSDGQIRRISAFTAGTITVDTAFASQIASGTKYNILGQYAIAAGGGGDATLANQVLMLADMGDASASTLGSLYAILGNPAQTFNAMVGYEGASSLASKLTAARAGYLDNINQAGLLQVTAARAGYLDNIAVTAAGIRQSLEVSITNAANAGDVTVATVTTQPCIIDSIIIHADTAQTANMTTCAVTGGASKVITFISTNDATQANLNTIDKQVAWASDNGGVRLAATKTIVISLVGTGAAAVDLTISITYHAAVSGGYLA